MKRPAAIPQLNENGRYQSLRCIINFDSVIKHRAFSDKYYYPRLSKAGCYQQPATDKYRGQLLKKTKRLSKQGVIYLTPWSKTYCSFQFLSVKPIRNQNSSQCKLDYRCLCICQMYCINICMQCTTYDGNQFRYMQSSIY